MCNLSQGILEKGEKKGLIEGKIEESAKNVTALIKKKKMSLTEAFDLLDVDENLKQQVIERLKNDGTI